MLELEGVSKSFGGHRVLTTISVSVDSHEIVGLIGPNGAGKSTLFNCITGVHRPSTGSIRMDGREIAGVEPHRVCHLGIARTFQTVRVFPSLTAHQNVRVGAEFGRARRSRAKVRWTKRWLEFVGLEDLGDLPASRLNLSQRRLVEIGRALAAKPDLLLLDEPMAGLNTVESAAMLEVIRRIRGQVGVAVCWVEHKLDAVFEACDRVVVLDYGHKIADGLPGEVSSNPAVIEAYLGGEGV